MDLVKVFEQTVRDLKREVNLKVLKIPEIEQKVLDATDEEPWGPHGSTLAEIAQATKKFSECQMVMNVLWTRLTETGKNWRLVYKSLTVLEYLVAHGSERAVDEIIEHTFQISSLASFEYVEPSGKDCGINVRKKAETIVSLLNDKDKIHEVRNKAASNRDKYFGLSSTGITYKSGTASFSSGNSQSGSRYGGFGAQGDRETSRDSYNDSDEYGEEKYESRFKSKTETPRYGRMEKTSSVSGKSGKLIGTNLEKHTSVPSADTLGSKYDEDSDDFDPRGSATSKPPENSQIEPSFPDIDLFGEPLAPPTGKAVTLENPSDASLFADADFLSAKPESEKKHDASDVNLFADADFVSAKPEALEKHSALESNADLFASHATPVSTPVDLFAIPETVVQPATSASKSDKPGTIVDPFASFPLKSFDGPDAFGSFASNKSSSVVEPEINVNNVVPPSEVNLTSAPKKQTFQVKSGIWADSLSRGLIDLNITAPKKVNLSDVGIVGGLTDGSSDNDKGPLPSYYMGGGALGTGYGIGGSRPGFSSTTGSTSDNFFTSLSDQQNHFGSFQK